MCHLTSNYSHICLGYYEMHEVTMSCFPQKIKLDFDLNREDSDDEEGIGPKVTRSSLASGLHPKRSSPRNWEGTNGSYSRGTAQRKLATTS